MSSGMAEYGSGYFGSVVGRLVCGDCGVWRSFLCFG